MHEANRAKLEQAVDSLTKALGEAKDAHAHMDRAAQYAGNVLSGAVEGGRRATAERQRDAEASLAFEHRDRAKDHTARAIDRLLQVESELEQDG